MEKGLAALPGHLSLEGSWRRPRSCVRNGFEREKYWAAPAFGNFPPSFSSASRPRHSYFGYRSAIGETHCTAVDSSISHEFRAFRTRRHFSEDSGFSSCGSSTSSVVDDSETPPGRKTLSCTDRHRLHSYHGAFTKFGSQSDTVAAVLAAGVSDSEETDNCETDEESDSVFFINDEVSTSSGQAHHPFTSPLSSGSDSSMASQIRCFLSKVVIDTSRKSERGTQENIRSRHFGRDILDLGSNLRTKFPLRSTELPAMNLPLFLQNRSQYHRLGEFGDSESFPFATCVKKCGFSFPIPPTEETDSK